MAIVTSSQGGVFNVPDDVLSKYKAELSPLTPEKAREVTGSDKPGKEQATGTMPKSAMASGDVQGYGLPIGDTPFVGDEICYIDTGPTVYWWYC